MALLYLNMALMYLNTMNGYHNTSSKSDNSTVRQKEIKPPKTQRVSNKLINSYETLINKGYKHI